MTRATLDGLVSFAAGLLFAIGLGISGMTRPDVILAFLDVTGRWDPSLLFVMCGATVAYFVLYRLILKRPAPLFSARFSLPSRKDIDARLVVGAAIFGVGWGLGGICPGPGIVASVSGAAPFLVFLGAMLAGMLLFRAFEARTVD